MIPYIGDFVEDDVVYLMFNTFSSDDPSASCTITNLLNTDVHIHKDDAVAQRNNAAGITVSVNFDGITGSHMIKIDTSDDTVGGFWVAGHDYFVRIEGTTVDAATINAVVGHFSIENRYMRGTDSAATAAALTTHDGKLDTVDTVVDGIQTDLSNATDGLGALKALIDTVDGVVDTILVDTSELQTNQGNWLTATGFSTHNAAAVWSVAARVLTANTNFNDLTAAEVKAEVVAALADIKLDHLLNIAVDTDWATTVHLDSVIGHMADIGTAATFNRTTDALEALRNRGDAAWIAATGFSTHSAADVKTAIEAGGSSLAQILADTGELQTDWVNGGRLDNLLDAIPTTAMRGTDGANTVVPDVAGTMATYDPPTRTEATADKDAIIADLLTMKKTTAGAYDRDTDSLEAIRNRGDSAWVTGAGGSAPTVGEIADAVWDEILTGATHNIATSAGRRVREIGAFAIHGGTAQAGTVDSITLAAGASADDGVYNRNLIAITEGTGTGQTRQIAEYNGTSKLVAVDRDWRVAPDATSVYQITADNVFALVDQGNAQAGSATTITLRAYASAIDDTYLCNIVAIIAGTGRGQARLVGSYNGTTKVATICGNNWVTTPDATSVYVMMPYGTTCTSCVGSSALTQIRTEMEGAGSKILAIEDDTDELQSNQSNWLTATGFSVPNEYDVVIATLSLEATLTAIKGATFTEVTDSLEAIRNRGDTAWITGAVSPTVEQIRTEMDDNSTKLAKIKSIVNFIRTNIL